MSAPPPSTPPPAEEISLRDLYLVLLRGLPIILGLGLLAGVAAYLYNSNRQPVYAAESTVLVTPPPIQIQSGDNLSFSPSYEVSLQTYETLARSQMVLQNAVERLQGGGARVSPQALSGLGSIRQLIGPQRPDQVVPLSVVHRVRNADPELAAQLADAWAQSTLEAVRESLFASLSPVDATTAQEVARLQGNIEEVEARYRTFSAGDNGPQLEAQLEGLTRELTDGRAREGQLRRAVAASEARVAELEALLSDAGAPAATDLGNEATAAVLELLSAQWALQGAAAPPLATQALPTDPYGGLRDELETFVASLDLEPADAAALSDLAAAIDSTASETLRRTLARQTEALQGVRHEEAQGRVQDALLRVAVLTQAPSDTAQAGPPQGAPADTAEDPATPPTGAAALLAEAALQAERVTLAGLQAELATLRAELGGYDEEASTLQEQIAALNQERGRLTRELEGALSSYTTVAELQSSVSYLTELAPTNARILSEASVPGSPVGPRRGFNTALAALLGALLGLVFVFLRAAVRPRPHTASRKVRT